MPEKLDFKIKPLTPIFTGGLEGKCDRLHETGIIGSMRWWFEAIVRGMGGYACDPSMHICKDGQYCDACKIFGSTGLKRVFRLNVEDSFDKDGDELQIRVVKDYQKVTANGLKTFNHNGWFLKPGVANDDLKIHIYFPVRSISKSELTATEIGQLLLLPLKVMSDWGGLAAKNQQGYGVFDLSDEAAFDVDKSIEALNKLLGKHKDNNVQANVPRIDQFFFSRIEFQIEEKSIKEFWNKRIYLPKQKNEEILRGDDSFLPLAPLVRYYLRSLIREQEDWSRDLRHLLMGEVKDNNRKKSLINCSHAYLKNDNTYEMRIWGWIPKTRQRTREEILTKLDNWTQSAGLLWDDTHCNLNVGKRDWKQRGTYETVEDYLRNLVGVGVNK